LDRDKLFDVPGGVPPGVVELGRVGVLEGLGDSPVVPKVTGLNWFGWFGVELVPP